jgi:hypothetical protein
MDNFEPILDEESPNEAPMELMSRFLVSVSTGDPDEMLPLIDEILRFEPNNAMIRDYKATLVSGLAQGYYEDEVENEEPEDDANEEEEEDGWEDESDEEKSSDNEVEEKRAESKSSGPRKIGKDSKSAIPSKSKSRAPLIPQARARK